MIEYIYKLTNNPIIATISLIATISFAVSNILRLFKFAKNRLKKVKTHNRLRLAFILLLFVLCGLISPVFVLIKSFSDWSGIYFWISQVLAWYVIYTFVATSFWVIKFEIELKQLKS